MNTISINSTPSEGGSLGVSNVPSKRSQCQDTAKVSRQQLQEAIAEQRLTDCLEQIENLGFLGEETQLFCLNLAHQLHRGCRV
ncbi:MULTISPECIES: hypothetical protein [Cyanophyceae]|uniref:hypothetical protein n=1 Tax=Cyanophyceae TaxID=3028117 RepID=UPI001687A5F8|nr:hypothetical protein [Trichocoleus sp. FACHB-40]MBD2006978.1 hypothetical protein [Trichocoleus sp. FACHB-40]